MSDEPKSDFSVWVGFAGQRKRHKPDNPDSFDPREELKKLPLDVIVTRTSLSQSLGCPGCGMIFVRSLWMLRCGACATLDYPKLVVFTACEVCGGESKVLIDHSQHQMDHPRIALPVDEPAAW
jgi:hypothetical protein